MSTFNCKSPIALNLLKLKLCGLYPTCQQYKLRFYTLWSVIVIASFNFGPNLFQSIYLIVNINDLEEVAAASFVTLPELLSLAKAFFVIVNMKVLKRLISTIESETFQPKNLKQEKMFDNNFMFWKTFYVVYWTMSFGAIFFWSTYPIFDKSISMHRLPFPAWYPLNVKQSGFYECAYLYQVFGVLCIATTAISVDTLICAIHIYITIQFDLLSDNVRHICDDTSNKSTSTQKLINCIKHHRQIIEFIADANQFSNWIMLLQFFISAVSIGITMFRLSIVTPLSSEFYSLTAFLLSIIVEIFMFCWCGNTVEIKV